MSYPEREQARPKINARLYSPYLGRFVSPDPLLNSEGGPLLYNPYVYANNNPFKYIDRNGEFIIFPVLSLLQYVLGNDAAVKACGVVATALSIGVGFYVGSVVTAGVGALGVSVGSPVIVGAAPFVGAAAGAAASYLTYNLSYSALTGTPVNFSWKDMGIEMGIAVATVGVCTVASKLASKSSKIMQTRHRPTAVEPDKIAAMAEAEKPVSTVSEYVRPETTTWEIDCGRRFPNTMLSDGNSVKITRPTITGYNDCLTKTDLYHQYPKIFDKFVVERGISRTVGNSSSYVLPGRCNGNPGFFQVNINNETGRVYHRFFYPQGRHLNMHVGKGANTVYFFK